MRLRRRVRADAARLALPVAARIGWREGTVVSAAVGASAKKKVAKATHIVEFKKKEVPSDMVGKEPAELSTTSYGAAELAAPRAGCSSSRSPLPRARAWPSGEPYVLCSFSYSVLENGWLRAHFLGRMLENGWLAEKCIF